MTDAWKLVPVEPTEEMVGAVAGARIEFIWSYVLAAAPTPDDAAIERVARALFSSVCEQTGSTEEEGTLISGDDWHQYLPEARAAIHAMEGSDD